MLPASATPHRPQDAIKEWLDGLLDGTVHTEPLQQLPAFVAAGAAEEGAEVRPEEAAVEEEFDLSDIMNVSANSCSRLARGGWHGCGWPVVWVCERMPVCFGDVAPAASAVRACCPAIQLAWNHLNLHPG